MIKDIRKFTELKMEKCIEAFKNQINKVYTGRASPNLFNTIEIKCYGKIMLLHQIANITVKDARTIKISIFDYSLGPTVEKAIILSNLDLNTNSDGLNIYVSLPLLTEERRKHLVKLIHSETEQARISVRKIRRDANDQIKKLLKERKISEDDERLAQNNIQTITDNSIKKIEETQEHKEKELMYF